MEEDRGRTGQTLPHIQGEARMELPARGCHTDGVGKA